MLQLLRKMFRPAPSRLAAVESQKMRGEYEVNMKTWSVVILFEDKPTREKAVKFCDQLVERHWSRCEFRMNWLGFSALGDSNAARDAAAKMRGADIIVFAIRGSVSGSVGIA